MPTIIDTLAIELSLDPTQLEKGISSVVEKVKTTRDDYERHAKGFEAVASGLLRTLTPLITAILGIGSALEAIDWSKNASAATTEFSNLADVIGMSVEKLSAWRQAAEAAGKGGGDALVQSFAHQQQEMLKIMPGGPGGMNTQFFGALQRYGLASDVAQGKYLDKNGNLDMDKFNRDLASASQRIDKTNAERALWMQKLYITNPAQLSLYKNREALEAELKKQREVVKTITTEQTSAMKQLHADWANLNAAAENLEIKIVAGLVKPLHEGLTTLQELLSYLKTWEVPDWIKKGVESGWVPPWFAPSVTPPGGVPGQTGTGQSWGDWLRGKPDSTTPTPPPDSAAPSPPATNLPRPSPTWPFRDPNRWHQGATPTPPATSVPSVPSTPLTKASPTPLASSVPAPPPIPSGPMPFPQPFPSSAQASPPPSLMPSATVASPSPPPIASVPTTPSATAPTSTPQPPAAAPAPAPMPAPPPTTSAPPPGSAIPPDIKAWMEDKRKRGMLTGEWDTSIPSAPSSKPSAPSEEKPGVTTNPFLNLPRQERGNNIPKPQSPDTPGSSPIKPQSFMDYRGILETPKMAALANQSTMASMAMPKSTVNTNSNVTIGAISFHAKTSQSMMDYAPSGSDKTLSIGAYAVDANTSLL